jgi:galactokinase
LKKETIISQSPGQINIIGEHTDYNEGFVLPAAVDKKTIFQLTKTGTGETVNRPYEAMIIPRRHFQHIGLMTDKENTTLPLFLKT